MCASSLAAVLSLLLSGVVPASAPHRFPGSRPSACCVTNGTVYAVGIGPDGTTYLGGDFTYLGPMTGAGVPVSAATGQRTAPFPWWWAGSRGGRRRIRRMVHRRRIPVRRRGAAKQHRSRAAGRHARCGLAPGRGRRRVCARDGGEDGLRGRRLHAIGGARRKHIAALDAGGIATAWNPGASCPVYALAVSGSTIFVGGGFTTIGGADRNRLAALEQSAQRHGVEPGRRRRGVCARRERRHRLRRRGVHDRRRPLQASTGRALRRGWEAAAGWNPSPSAAVHALAVSRGMVYAAERSRRSEG